MKSLGEDLGTCRSEGGHLRIELLIFLGVQLFLLLLLLLLFFFCKPLLVIFGRFGLRSAIYWPNGLLKKH
jgi:hypothetical protein